MAIERAAVELFRGHVVYDVFTASSGTADDYAAAIDADKIWVVEVDGLVAGFATIDVRDGEGYLEEVDVDPAFARRGLGSALVEHACDLTRARGLPSMTLSTLSDVPWNRPLYERLGFTVTTELTPALQAVRSHEAALGFPLHLRVIMRRRL